MLEVTEFSSDFQSGRHKSNLINNHLNMMWAKC